MNQIPGLLESGNSPKPAIPVFALDPLKPADKVRTLDLRKPNVSRLSERGMVNTDLTS